MCMTTFETSAVGMIARLHSSCPQGAGYVGAFPAMPRFLFADVPTMGCDMFLRYYS